MKKLIAGLFMLALSILCTSGQQVFYYSSTGAWLDTSKEPFPNLQVSPDKKEIAWGNVSEPSRAILHDTEGGFVAGGSPAIALALQHHNNPIESWWEPGDSSFDKEAATADVLATITLYDDIAYTQEVGTFLLGPADITFYETRNLPTLRDDVWLADTGIDVEPFIYDNGVYLLRMAGFFSPTVGIAGGLGNRITEFHAPEGGTSTGWVGIELEYLGAVPEPATYGLLGLGLILAALLKRRGVRPMPQT